MTPVSSTAVSRIGWLPLPGSSAGTVYIEWRDARGSPSGTYAYPGVSLADWSQLSNAALGGAGVGAEANRIKRRHGARAAKVG
jgi:hypothetical protein